jgi:hypothetical protein
MQAIAKSAGMRIPPILRRILVRWPAALVLLGVVLTFGWIATLVWLLTRSVWGAF